MNFEDSKINILGTVYSIKFKNENDDINLKENDAYTDWTTKTIIICIQEDHVDMVHNMELFYKKILRHEIIHAFLYESGLHVQSDWACNEEMVDYFACQFDKITKAIEIVDDLFNK